MKESDDIQPKDHEWRVSERRTIFKR